ncbi:patatin-like phospholipase family protein, partial [Streptomyces viridochromogenes]|uniref:patatin-like phospholipase family protein n=1 Tax=Streptomyces viridochromogenes TaxID=1938 RepID=UPI0015C4FF62
MTRTLGLALSGGGSRAAAFHLGCLRALHDRDLLDSIRVVSGISGGSLLAA